LLSQDWRFEMMKTLDHPDSFPKNFQNYFQANIYLKKQDAMLLATGFATVAQIASSSFEPVVLTTV